MTNSERIYRILLKAYPARYLREYEESMRQLFADQLRDANPFGKLVHLWFRTLSDLAKTLPARHTESSHADYFNLHFTDQFRRATFFARSEASSFGRREITPEHLLLAALREDRELADRLLGVKGVDEIQRAIEAAEPGKRRVPPNETLPISAECRRAIQAAQDEAARAGVRVDARLLLMGIIRQETSLAAQLLQRQGVDFHALSDRG